MEFSAEMIAGLIGGTVVGDPKTTVNNFAKIEEGKPGCISFLANEKYENYIYQSESSIILVNNSFEPKHEINATLIKVENARAAVSQLLAIYDSMKPKKKGIHPMAFIAPTAKVDETCYVGPFACIGEHVTVGKDTIINANVVIYDGCHVGERCILHSGCVIGADGFGFEPDENGYNKIPQIGNVIIEDDVEIGANTCVDRAVMGSTIVHKGVKLDNLVQIAHNDEIGSHTVMSAQVGIAGSTKVGEWCMFGGQVGIAGHASIADKTMVGAQSGIPNSIKKPGTVIQGSPAIEGRNFWKSSAIFKNLPQMWADMNEMKKEIKALKEELANR